MKKCSKCGIEKDLTCFAKAKRNKDGLKGQCRECISKISKIYREKNAEKIARETHANKAAKREYDKQYRKDNSEKRRVYAQKYYKQNIETISANTKQYKQNNPHKVLKYNQSRRFNAEESPMTLTCAQWDSIKEDFGYKCCYCGKTEQSHLKELSQKLHQEHFVPLSKGGEYSRNNIIPVCIYCNSSKRNKSFFEWYPEYEYYSKEREDFILEYLGYKENIQQLSIL